MQTNMIIRNPLMQKKPHSLIIIALKKYRLWKDYNEIRHRTAIS